MEHFSLLDAPLLVGVSRKSMMTKLLDIDAASALPATAALNMAALERGAKILRVHDVPEAVQVVKLWKAVKSEL
jgi:dihydropteroate synthase